MFNTDKMKKSVDKFKRATQLIKNAKHKSTLLDDVLPLPVSQPKVQKCCNVKNQNPPHNVLDR